MLWWDAVLSSSKAARLLSQGRPYGRPFPLHQHWRSLQPFSSYRDSLSNTHATTRTDTRGQGQGYVWNVWDLVPRTCIFSCLFSGFSLTVFMPNLLINTRGSPLPSHTHTSLTGNINNSRGHHWGFSAFLKVWSRMAVGSLERNMLSPSQGWTPSS